MQTLIDTNSDLYGKRLVKAIKEAFEHGVYVDANVAHTQSNPRIRRVRFEMRFGRICCHTNQGIVLVSREHFDNAFFDGYGREIVATRRA